MLTDKDRPDDWPRLYPLPAFVAERLGLFVRVSEHTRRAVVYVGSNIDGNFLPLGTAFAAGIRYRDQNVFFFVTADHVVDDVPGEHIFIRMNLRAGQGEPQVGPPIRVAKSSRVPGINRQLDLAIFPVPPLYETYDADYVLLDRAQYNDIIRDVWKPGLGDEVAVVGLYTSHHGLTKNIPVVRVGHIAMMPDEPVRSTRGDVEAYLVEVKSIVGLSGSPVYITIPPMRVKNGKIELLETDTDQPGAICIGMMLGYHLVASREDQVVVPQHQGEERTGTEYSLDERNTGFGVVLPIERLFDVMESDGMKRALDRAIDGPRNNTRVRPASAPFRQQQKTTSEHASSAEENPQHLKDFRRLVDVAARKRPQGDQT